MARRGTVPRPHDEETSTSRSRMSDGSSSQGHVSPAREDRDVLEAPEAYAHEDQDASEALEVRVAHE